MMARISRSRTILEVLRPTLSEMVRKKRRVKPVAYVLGIPDDKRDRIHGETQAQRTPGINWKKYLSPANTGQEHVRRLVEGCHT